MPGRFEHREPVGGSQSDDHWPRSSRRRASVDGGHHVFDGLGQRDGVGVADVVFDHPTHVGARVDTADFGRLDDGVDDGGDSSDAMRLSTGGFRCGGSACRPR